MIDVFEALTTEFQIDIVFYTNKNDANGVNLSFFAYNRRQAQIFKVKQKLEAAL